MTLLCTYPQLQALHNSALTARCQLPCGCVLLEDDTVLYPHGERATLAQHDAWLAEAQVQEVKHERTL